MKSFALFACFVVVGVACADRYDDIAVQSLARAIHHRSTFIPDRKSECDCDIGGVCRCVECKCVAPVKRKPSVIDSHDLGQPKVVKKAAPKKVAKKVVRRVEPVYYTMPSAMYAPGPSFGGFGGGWSGGGVCSGGG